jgi:hypothetical protein
VRLEPLYQVEFTTQEAWRVDLRGDAGVEEHSFLVVEGRTRGRVDARFRGANSPRRRVDGTLTPHFRGALETDDGATILFAWQGYGLTSDDGARRLVGSITHVTGDARYRWLNDVIGVVCGEVRKRDDGRLDVVLEVAELVWERPG